MSPRTQPPGWATRLAEWLVEPKDRGVLLGDLHEGFLDRVDGRGRQAATRWYVLQVARLARALGPARIGAVLIPIGLLRDLRYGVRGLRRAPVLVFVSVLTLAVGIGAPATMFGIGDGMFALLPVPDAERIMAVEFEDASGRANHAIFDAHYRVWRASTSAFDVLGAYRTRDVALSGDGRVPDRRDAALVTPGVLEALGALPIAGRLVDASDLAPGAPAVALVREDLWDERYGRDGGTLGTDVRIDGTYTTIVGVLPRGFGFPVSQSVWLPLRTEADPDRPFEVVGRLAVGATAASAQDELQSVVDGLSAGDGAGAPSVRVEEFVLADQGAGTRELMRYLNLVVSLLVAIAAANVTGMLLARGVARAPAAALQLALGGSRWRVARGLILEAALLALGGAAFGVLLAHGALGWFEDVLLRRGSLPFWARLGITPAVLGFAAILALVATVVAGLVPAVRAARVDLGDALRAGGRSGRLGARLLSAVVAAEVSVSAALLLLCALLVRGAFAAVALGDFPTDRVLTAGVALEAYDYPDAESRRAFFAALDGALSESSEVEAYTVSAPMPGDGAAAVPVRLPGATYDREQDVPRVQRRLVDPSFFSMFEMPLVSGRLLGPSDDADGAPVAVVNEAFVRAHLGGAGALDSRLTVGSGEAGTEVTVVGVVGDPGVSVDDGRRVAALFLPTAQLLPTRSTIAVRTRPRGRAPVEVLRNAVRAIDADLPLEPVRTLDDVVRRENDGGRVFTLLFGSFGLGALVLALVGLHGVVSLQVSERTHEIGVRRALGAPRGLVWRSQVHRGVRPVLVGLALGSMVAWAMAPSLVGSMFDFEPRDPVLFTAVVTVLLVGAIVAAGLPARRAAGIDPSIALRGE